VAVVVRGGGWWSLAVVVGGGRSRWSPASEAALREAAALPDPHATYSKNPRTDDRGRDFLAGRNIAADQTRRTHTATRRRPPKNFLQLDQDPNQKLATRLWSAAAATTHAHTRSRNIFAAVDSVRFGEKLRNVAAAAAMTTVMAAVMTPSGCIRGDDGGGDDDGDGVGGDGDGGDNDDGGSAAAVMLAAVSAVTVMAVAAVMTAVGRRRR
jgi:hypothetical protein